MDTSIQLLVQNVSVSTVSTDTDQSYLPLVSDYKSNDGDKDKEVDGRNWVCPGGVRWYRAPYDAKKMVD